ncbi:MAG TPA: AsmA family protein [Burkholderiales bacterium]|nr:AsmA family protein [Burkholderiales bacterium]
MSIRFPRWLTIALLTAAGMVVAAVVGLVVLIHTIDLGKYAKLATDEVKAATGRELRIRGKLDVKLFPHLALVAEDVSFANAPWGSRPDMARAKRLEGSVALLPLLRKRVEVTRLVLVEPDVLLETDAKGIGNWVFKPPAAAKPAAPGEPGGADFDLLGASIDRGQLAWRNGAKKEMQRFAIQRLRLERKTFGDVLNVDLAAAFRDQPFTMKGSMGLIRRLLAKDSSWPVDLAFATAGATAKVKGTVDFSAKLPTLDGEVKAEVNDAAGLAKLSGGAFAPPVPLTLTAKAKASRDEYLVDPMHAAFGKSAIEGRVAVKTGGVRPFATASVKSSLVDLASLGARGGKLGAGGKDGNGRMFSDAPFPLEGLRTFDGAADAAIERLVLPSGLPLDKVQVKAALKDGRLEVQPLQALVGGGTVAGRATLDAARARPATLAFKVEGKGISGEKVAAAMGHAGTVSGGNTDLALGLAGPGESLARFMGGANGEIRATMGPARTSGAALDFGGDVLTKIADLANPTRRTEKYNEIQCAVVRLPVRDGIATAERTIAMEAARVNIVAAGTINLRNESLDLALRPNVKEGLGIGAANLAELVRVTGTLSNPSVGIDTLGSARTALSVGGAILTGGLSLLGEAALRKGTADPHPCQTALAGGKPSSSARQEAKPAQQDEGGVLGSIRRLFK